MDGAFEIEADITPDANGIAGIEISNNKRERTLIYFDMKQGKVVMDRTESGLTDFGKQAVPHDIELAWDKQRAAEGKQPARIENAINWTLTRRFVDFSYVDGNEYVFMDKEDYTPYTFTKEQIEEELQFIPEGGMPDMQVLTWDGQLLALELPQTVDLEIIETAPGIKGASASSRTKPATMSTGLVIQVPEYLTTGEKIRIHIEECRYMGRAD